MFEELHRTHPVHLTNDKRNKLYFLLSHEFSFRIIDELEAQVGRKFSTEKRNNILRRLQEEYKKRPIQADSYEQWHSKQQRVGSKQIQDKSREKRRKVIARDVLTENFDEDVKQLILRELTEEQQKFESENETSIAAVRAGCNESETSNLVGPSSSQSSSDSDSTSSSEAESGSDLPFDKGFGSDGGLEHSFHFDHEAPEDSNYALQKHYQWKEGSDTLRTWARDRYQIKTRGLELLEENSENVSSSLRKQHLKSLTALLHINILRRNWNLAHKLVCAIVRFDVADLRALWPLAVEVLARKKDEMRIQGSISKLGLLKEQQFLEWLSLSFPVSHNNPNTSYAFQGPVFRSATRRYAPVYVITLLWELLVAQDYSKLRDMVEDLILQPPYSTDGVFYFVLVLCNIAESIHLVSCYINYDINGLYVSEKEDIGDIAEDLMLMSSKDTIKARIVSNLSRSATLLETCRNLNFEYPEELIQDELDNLYSAIRDSAIDIREVIICKVASYHDKTGYVLLNGKVCDGSGPNILRGKFLKKLVVDANSRTSGFRSWIWEWMRPVEGKRNLSVCDSCGEYILKARTSNKKLEDHLAQHGIFKTTKLRISEARMNLFREAFKEIIAAQDDDSMDSQSDFTSSNIQTCDFTNRAENIDANNARVADLNAAIRSEISEIVEQLFLLLSHNQESEIDSSKYSEEERNASADDDSYKEESLDNVRVADEVNSQPNTPQEQEYWPSKAMNTDVAPITRGSAKEVETPNAILNKPSEAASSQHYESIRRYDTFSPDSTVDGLVDADISRNFEQFATQTQDKYIDYSSQAITNTPDIFDSQAILNSFTDHAEALQPKTAFLLQQQEDNEDNAAAIVKKEELYDFSLESQTPTVNINQGAYQ